MAAKKKRDVELWEVLDAVNSGFTEMEHQFRSFEGRFDTLEKRIDDLEKRFGARFSSVEQRLDSIEKRLTSVEQKLDQLFSTESEDILLAFKEIRELKLRVKRLESKT